MILDSHSSCSLKVGELARRTGLTVRTLHHYDEIGLLRPSLHSEGGHRLYTKEDVARLQQIISLRQIGFSLDDVRACLNQVGFSAEKVIDLHLTRLQKQLEIQVRVREKLEWLKEQMDQEAVVSADDFLKTIEVLTMMEKLYTPEEMKQFQEVGKQAGKDEIRAIEAAWAALLNELRASQETELVLSSAEAQLLAQRWEELNSRTMRWYQNYPELMQAIANNYTSGSFEGHSQAPQATDFAFIERIKAARGESH